jgi:hypothetical protein
MTRAWDDTCRLDAVLHHFIYMTRAFLYFCIWGGPETNPLWILKEDYTSMTNWCQIIQLEVYSTNINSCHALKHEYSQRVAFEISQQTKGGDGICGVTRGQRPFSAPLKSCFLLSYLPLACKICPDKETELNPLTLTHPNKLVIRDQKECRCFCYPQV